VSKVLLDTDIYSEVIKAINPTVTQNALAYRQKNGVLTLSVITVMEIVRGFQQKMLSGQDTDSDHSPRDTCLCMIEKSIST
jgi:predicted nucleic acid-binding protein